MAICNNSHRAEKIVGTLVKCIRSQLDQFSHDTQVCKASLEMK